MGYALDPSGPNQRSAEIAGDCVKSVFYRPISAPDVEHYRNCMVRRRLQAGMHTYPTEAVLGRRILAKMKVCGRG
jgi:hypothetical protein